ncbi:peptidoglycan DD-metalloendopeptidase family protein [Modestobacter sp. I12A-02628]|uniref:M23 family metallopeptidase n=1 Tax=Goekera deserti TaxID=2497753 RepID=A0A7K3WBT2_9ACTN|nr:M23 family metallopeptidase [Goekera deserti]MPQ98693.1 peptidoglycan DD-metalloendopeptidase family protein [Goekera deserti]NDI49255.1 peptidoglycan DD-metalloendopeptidase family protein [Goekera deserti]NEL52993.1 M23 family metallopeptidase [Goekera deserti]
MLQRRTGAPVPGARRPGRAALLSVLVTVLLTLGAAPATAAPEPPPNPTDEQIGAASQAQQAAAAEVGRIAALVADAEGRLEQAQFQAEAAGTAYLAAEEALGIAQAEADRAAAASQAAADAVAVAQVQLGDMARDSYISGGSTTSTLALLAAEGPSELLQQAAILDYVTANQVDVLDALQVARVQQANADRIARAARDETAAAEAAAAEAKQVAEDQLASQQAVFEEVTAQKAEYERQLQDAEVALLQLQGARDAYGQWLAAKQAEEAAAAAAAAEDQARTAAAARSARGAGGTAGQAPTPGSANYVKPASGRVSSCFGSRWGTTHFGVDIAAPIGTPIYAATSGTVQRAGAASGFGQAVYIRGDDGAVTVYGHVNSYYVEAGERVSAGEEIAEVGNRGQSTGPHLHFEVHPGGLMYGGQTDPVPWMNARGISLGGCGG